MKAVLKNKLLGLWLVVMAVVLPSLAIAQSSTETEFQTQVTTVLAIIAGLVAIGVTAVITARGSLVAVKYIKIMLSKF